MNALLVLYAGNLSEYAFSPLYKGKNSISLTVEQARNFPGVSKTALLTSKADLSFLNDAEIVQQDSWTKRSLLEKIAELQEGYDFAYFAFADCPFLDVKLAGNLASRLNENSAEYAYADGWPYGTAPEILAPGTAAILAKILKDEDEYVSRDIIFSVLQKDINAFDIEVEISPVDLRCHRLSLCADSKRNFLLLKNFIGVSEKIPDAAEVEGIIQNKPQILRTLPAFYPVQVCGGCPQKCSYCPYPLSNDVLERKDYMDTGRFEALLDKITSFSGDAVIDLSLWGEISLHPEKMSLIKSVLSRKELSLIIETSGIGWKNEELDELSSLARNMGEPGKTPSSISWIVSLDTDDPAVYSQLRGSGFAQAKACAVKLLSLFPKDCYVQAVRLNGSQDDTEKFYRYWKEASPNGDRNIIIQKYSDFCGSLEKRQASDLSPLVRQACWHIMRDMCVLLDGTVPLCRDNLKNSPILGNVFSDSLEDIWHKGGRFYNEHCEKNYGGECLNCDEYYTYNF